MNRITINISTGDYFKSQLMHYKFSTSRLAGSALALAWIGYFLYEEAGVSAASVIGGTLGFMLWYTSYFLLYLRWRCKRIYEQQKSLHTPTEAEWDSENIEFTHSSGHVKMKWSDFAKYKESDDLIMLYHSDALFSFIPNHHSPLKSRCLTLSLTFAILAANNRLKSLTTLTGTG